MARGIEFLPTIPGGARFEQGYVPMRVREDGDGGVRLRLQPDRAQRMDRLYAAIAGDPGYRFSRLVRRIMEDGRVDIRDESGRVVEELTTSDFTYLTGEYITKTVWDNYRQYDTIFPTIGYRQEVPDFKDAHIIEPYQTQDLPRVYQKDEYKAETLSETEFTVAAYKYGRQFDVSFETLVNDDTDTIRKEPVRMGRSVSYTQQRLFSTQYIASTTLYTAAQGNLLTTALSINNLETAIATMMAWTDRANNVISNEPRYLVVPPALALTAEEILNSVQMMWLGDTSSGQTDRRLPMRSAVANRLSLLVDPFIGVVNGSSTSEWYLFADPADIPSVIYAELRGHVGPEVYIHDTDALRLPGGSADPYDGSFINDDISFKVRMFYGTAEGEWRGTLRSTGAS